MKSTIIKSLTLLLLIFFGASCTEESTVQMNDESSQEFSEKSGTSSVWDGVIGVERNGVYEIVADEAAIKQEFENILKREDNATTLTSLAIVEKVSTNDPTDVGYMLIGSDGNEISIAIALSKNVSGQSSPVFVANNNFKSFSCRGCAQGCNLEYMTIHGKKYPYCNENGCFYNCKKSESSL